MRTILTLIAILLFSSFSFSQQAYIDSLLKVVEDPNIDRSGAYNLLYKKLKRTNRDSVKTLYLDKAFAEAIKYSNDSTQGVALNFAGYYYMLKSELDTAESLYIQALKIRVAEKDSSGVSRVYNNLGTLYKEKSNFQKAAEYTEKALEYKLLLKDTLGAGISYNALGSIYSQWNKNEQAINQYQKALVYFEKINELNGVASCYNNIGLIYQSLAKEKDTVLMNKAIEYYYQALVINEKTQNLWEQANAQSNIANMYSGIAEQYLNKGKSIKDTTLKAEAENIGYRYFDKALDYVQKSAKNREIVGDIQGQAGSYAVIGSIYVNKKEAKLALPYLKKALEINNELNDKYQRTVILTYLGMTYINLGQYNNAIETLTKAEKIAKENNIKREYNNIYDTFAEVYDSIGDYKKALNAHRLYKAYEDTAYSKQNLQIITDMQTKYETEQKEAALEIANTKNEKQELQSQRQMLIIYGFIGVFIIVIFFSFIVYRQFKQIRRSNVALSEQKAQIEEANEELNQQNEEIAAQRDEIQDQKDHIEHIHKAVSDSIHYAERIQKAILPKVEDLEDKITDRFTLFKPKDIVSGDFYWQKHIKRSNLFVATAADCTGHGVPGAFMSMLGIAFLNEIVNKSSITNTGQVLDNLRQSVISSLHQTGKAGEAQDGMDIALIALNYETKVLQFSGANNPLYIIRAKDKPAITCDKIEEGGNHILYEIKGDKMPIGIYKKELTDFKTTEIQLEIGDAVYMFSDGYADQFGGPKGKKLKYKPFKDLLLDHFDLPMQEQADILNKHFEEWRGNLEQIDDVIVMGIKI